MSFADLHIHTYYSDSTASPQEVIDEARNIGLGCIAITDHDTVDGLLPTIEEGKKHNIEVLTGIELSSEINGRDVHILGYLFDLNDQFFYSQLELMQDSRIERMKGMIKKLEDLGIKGISLEEVCALSESKSVGRPHLAKILMDKGKVSSMKQAFDRYLAEGAPAYVSKYKQSPYEAIDLIRKAGVVSVLAHPMLTQIDELIPSLVEHGLSGLEVYYPNCSENIIFFYSRIAQKHKLIMTGGSDAHGKAKKNTHIGRVKVPYECVEQLKLAKSQLRLNP